MPTPLGPENLPTNKPVSTDYPVVVLVLDCKNAIVKKEEINYSNSEHRKYLGRLTHYAFENGYSVKSIAKKDFSQFAESKV